MPSQTYPKHDPSLLPCSRLRLTIRQITSESRFSSVNKAGVTTSVRTSRVARTSALVIKGRSTSSSLEICKAYLHAAVAPIQGRIQRQLQAGHAGDVDEVSSAVRKHDEPFFRRRQIGGQQLALRLVVLDRKGELVLLLPTVLRQQCATGCEIGQR